MLYIIFYWLNYKFVAIWFETFRITNLINGFIYLFNKSVNFMNLYMIYKILLKTNFILYFVGHV